jgi:hypothetical protein
LRHGKTVKPIIISFHCFIVLFHPNKFNLLCQRKP